MAFLFAGANMAIEYPKPIAVTPVPNVRYREFTKCGQKPLAGGRIWTYEANSTTPKVTYKDPYGITPNTNPIILDAAGEADIYLNGTYRFVVEDKTGVIQKDVAKIGSWYSGDLDDQFKSLNDALETSAQQLMQPLQDAIDTALASGAGDAGWTDTLIQVIGGTSQRSLNSDSRFGQANRFISNLAYPLGAFVLLNDGTEVMSILHNNKNDPNLDMTGWQSKDLRSVDELRSSRGLSKGTIVNLKSVYLGQNTGGGQFIITQKSGLVDDGGTVIKMENLGENIYAVRLNFTEATPDMFGCIGDGITDDTESFLKFAKSPHQHKTADKFYAIKDTALFTVSHPNSVIDLSKSTIVGADFDYVAVKVIVDSVIQTLKIKAGSYDGEGVVNGYLEAISVGIGEADIVELTHNGAIRNLSNSRNTKATFGTRLEVLTKVAKSLNPVVSNVYNINGTAGVQGAVGAGVYNFTQLGLVENPTIDGVYTNNVDADGVSIFEAKLSLSTGTGLAIVRNGDFKQCAGRAIKTQCSLYAQDNTINLKEIEKGVVITNWRGIDAQFGNLIAKNTSFSLWGRNTLSPSGDTCLFTTNGNPKTLGSQNIEDVTIDGDSTIRYLLLINVNDVKDVFIDRVKLLSPQSDLSCLYVTAGRRVHNTISIRNISKGWSANKRLLIDTVLNTKTSKLVVENIEWDGYPTLDVSFFNQLKVLNANIIIEGTLTYGAIDPLSMFTYTTDKSSGGLTYTNTNIPAWAKRYIKYEKGVVFSDLRNNSLTQSNGRFYQSLSNLPSEIN